MRDGFTYHRVGHVWRERARDGVMIKLHVWRGQCGDCGEEYLFANNLQLPAKPNRRCKRCKKPGVPATPYKRPRKRRKELSIFE